MSDHTAALEETQSRLPEQAVLALLLVLGLYFPTSTNGEHSTPCVVTALVVLIGLVVFLIWRLSPRRGAGTYVVLPLLIVLSVCTIRALCGIAPQFDPGIAVKFGALALILTLNLQQLHFGRAVEAVFAAANSINLACGAAILVGSQWMAEFLSRYYWSFYPNLIPNMMRLHKPVLTLGTHASASFFFYLFFLMNWERYKNHGGKTGLIFAFSYVVLLLALTSFSSLGFGCVALVQVGTWFGKRHRTATLAVALCLAMAVSYGAAMAAEYIDIWQLSQLELGTTFLNTDQNGPWARYGSGGGSVPAVAYLFESPLSPIGLTTPPERAGGSAALGDSGPIEYLLRGSVPLLAVMYFGLYRFLRFNLARSSHALFFFFLVLGFETAFSLLVYFRTLYLLPFFIVYLNTVTSAQADRVATHDLVLAT
jgi:hypothetical protein